MPGQQVADITVGNNPENLVTYGERLYVAVESGSQLVVIDTTTNTVSGRMEVGAGPWWMSVVETGGGGAPDAKLYVLRGSDLSMTVVSLAPAGGPTAQFPCDTFGGLQILPTQLADTRRGGVYICDQANNRLLVFSGATNTIVDHVPLGYMPWRMVVSADGSRVYVTHPNDKMISVVDLIVTPPSVTPVRVAQTPWDVFAAPRGDRLYMTHWISEVAGLFRVIDLTTMLAGSVNTHLEPVMIAGDDARAYVSAVAGHCIDVLDTSTVPPQLVDSIPVNGSPGYLAVSDDRKTLYASNFTGDTVMAVSLTP